MSVALMYLFVGIFVFCMNIFPFLMPPTWLVLAFFHFRFELSVPLLVLIGAVAATSGRVCLAILSRNYLRRWLPRNLLENYDDLGKFFSRNQRLTIPVVLLYAFSPIPSNQVFIVAGLAGLDLRVIAASFFVGRLISYTFWVTVTHEVADHLEAIFVGHLSSTGTFLVELAGILLIYFIGRISWRRLLKMGHGDDS